ncbi:MAG: hypothetical protein U9O20_00620 [Patescibacteria group bacterium]|nr:hypothetical protein [Patescibacteria group bacterium]
MKDNIIGFLDEDEVCFMVIFDHTDNLSACATFNFCFHLYFLRKGKVKFAHGKEDMNLCGDTLITDFFQILLKMIDTINVSFEEIGDVSMKVDGDFPDSVIINCWMNHPDYVCFELVEWYPCHFGKDNGLYIEQRKPQIFECIMKLKCYN